MQRILTTVALGGVLALGAGCISYEVNLSLEKDGSGTVVVDTWVDYLGEEEGDQEVAEAPEISEEMGPAFAELEGVTVEENWARTEGEGDDRREHTHLLLAFEDVEILSGQGIFENQDLTFEKKGKEYVFTHEIRNVREQPAAETAEESSEENEELARALFEGYTFTYTVVMPGDVTDTNGIVADDGRTVTWEWPLYDFAQQEEIVMTATSR
ncbi:MAG: hypothetical protein JSU81_05950 [Candidatus Coatesbacteria bacterium]|nr:MAG: hypothetical protein JSU81_05950 [Candidatus Coatesbacteria bacterium]